MKKNTRRCENGRGENVMRAGELEAVLQSFVSRP